MTLRTTHLFLSALYLLCTIALGGLLFALLDAQSALSRLTQQHATAIGVLQGISDSSLQLDHAVRAAVSSNNERDWAAVTRAVVRREDLLNSQLHSVTGHAWELGFSNEEHATLRRFEEAVGGAVTTERDALGSGGPATKGSFDGQRTAFERLYEDRRYLGLLAAASASGPELLSKLDQHVATQSRALIDRSHRYAQVALGIIIFLTLVTLGTHIEFARQLIRPLLRGRAIADEIAEGRPAPRWNVPSENELGQLADAFNSMLNALETRSKELSTANDALRSEIGERARAESALQLSESRYRLLFESASDPVLIFDAESGRLCEANAASAKLYGYERNELLNLKISDLSADAKDAPETLRVPRGDMNVRYHRKRDGSVIAVDLNAASLTLNDEHFIIATVRNVSARIYAENELRRTRDLLQKLIDISPNLIFVKDRQGRFTLVNETKAKAFGMTVASMIGRTDRDIHLPDKVEKFAREDRQVLEQGVSLVMPDELVTFPDGSRHWLRTTKQPLRSQSGDIEYLYGVATDITELKEAQHAAEATAHAKASFLATMSHEIRSPMNSVLGYAQLLSQTNLDAEQGEYVEVIMASGEILLQIINEILDFSKIESGHLTLNAAPVDATALVDSVVALMDIKARMQGIELVFARPVEEIPLLQLDELRLKQILINLIANAVKFTNHGGVYVSLAVEPVSDGRARVTFSVNDSGIGIPAEILPELFKPFTQAHTNTSKQFGGTGLGLAICKKLCMAMGGDIHVESQVGRGSTFKFHVLAEYAPTRQALPRQPLPGSDGSKGSPANLKGRCRVLVVDDNDANVTLVLRFLERLGYGAMGARSGEEALRMLRVHVFDVVLMDIRMPGMDGYETVRRIRAG